MHIFLKNYVKNIGIKKSGTHSGEGMHTVRGFGIIEILVSVAIFTVVATMGIAAVLALIDAGEKAQSYNAVMQNLNVGLETMARTIRTGQKYVCVTTVDGACTTIQFTPATSDLPMEYIWDSTNKQIVVKDSNGVQTAVTSNEVTIDSLEFRIHKVGATELGASGNGQNQVVMFVGGYVQTRSKNKVRFNLQTTMTQRIIDID
jgi:type II secretory pathway pseudopilin PulG